MPYLSNFWVLLNLLKNVPGYSSILHGPLFLLCDLVGNWNVTEWENKQTKKTKQQKTL